MRSLAQLSAVKKGPPTSTITCRCAGRSRLELWGEPSGSFDAGCCGYRVVFVKPTGTSGSSDPAGRAQVIRCGCSWTVVRINRGPVLGSLRCGHCKASVDFVAEMVKPPRAACVDNEVAR